MLKKKYVIIIVLATISIFAGSLSRSNVVSSASSSSGSWGTIRFFDPTEYNQTQKMWKDTAIFTWTPDNMTNNAILNVAYYAEYKTLPPAPDGPADRDWRIVVNDQEANWEHTFTVYGEPNYTWTPLYSWLPDGTWDTGNPLWGGITPNQPSYTIKFQILVRQGTAYFRSINVILTVADGMVPNEYYKVELPSKAVGGLWVPVNKLALLAPYIALVSTIILAVSISVAYIKYRKKQ